MKVPSVVIFVLVGICVSTAKGRDLGLAAQTDRQSTEASAGTISTFYAHSRQVIVEAEVWDKTKQKRLSEDGTELTRELRSDQKDTLKHLPSAATGLKAVDFRVFDNSVEQKINYLKEADFPVADVRHQWWFVPTPTGTWGTPLAQNSALMPASATYLIGYVPPPLRPGECHKITVLVDDHEVQLNRDQYCAPVAPQINDVRQGTKFDAKMLRVAASSRQSVNEVSLQAFAFWSSGVLSLVKEPLTGRSTESQAGGFSYQVEVHDAKAPATVQIAAQFGLPTKRWDYPCKGTDAINVLVVAYNKSKEVAAWVRDTSACSSMVNYELKAWHPDFILAPNRFDTHLNLAPGDYDLVFVASDGDYFAKARIPLRVEPLNSQGVMLSDLVVGGVLRSAFWVVREAAFIAPYPVTPNPLVSKNIQFFPDTDTAARLHKGNPLYLYFEIYGPPSVIQTPTPSYRMRMTDLKTGAIVMNTDLVSARDFVVPENSVVPIGVKLDIDKLNKGVYKLEVQASDSAGHESEWRSANVNIQ
jgi:hypothetical protein